VFLDVGGVKIHGWWIPSSFIPSDADDRLPVILHFHGNAGTLPYLYLSLLSAWNYRELGALRLMPPLCR